MKLWPRGRPSPEWVTLEEGELRPEAPREGVRLWRSTEGDAVGVYFFNVDPDLPSGINSEVDFLEAYRAMLEGLRTSPVEASLLSLGGHRALSALGKVPVQGRGTTYVASITFPFQHCSWVIKAQCEEWSPTGVREAILLDEALASGIVQVSPEDARGIIGDWDPDAPLYDDRFPKHPVSRARRQMRRVERQISFSRHLRGLAPFGLP